MMCVHIVQEWSCMKLNPVLEAFYKGTLLRCKYMYQVNTWSIYQLNLTDVPQAPGFMDDWLQLGIYKYVYK